MIFCWRNEAEEFCFKHFNDCLTSFPAPSLNASVLQLLTFQLEKDVKVSISPGEMNDFATSNQHVTSKLLMKSGCTMVRPVSCVRMRIGFGGISFRIQQSVGTRSLWCIKWQKQACCLSHRSSRG